MSFFFFFLIIPKYICKRAPHFFSWCIGKLCPCKTALYWIMIILLFIWYLRHCLLWTQSNYNVWENKKKSEKTSHFFSICRQARDISNKIMHMTCVRVWERYKYTYFRLSWALTTTAVEGLRISKNNFPIYLKLMTNFLKGFFVGPRFWQNFAQAWIKFNKFGIRWFQDKILKNINGFF